MINAETYRLAVKMICDGQDVKNNPCSGCPACKIVHWGESVSACCATAPDYNGDGSPVPIVEKWLQDNPDKAAEIERMVAEMEDENNGA